MPIIQDPRDAGHVLVGDVNAAQLADPESEPARPPALDWLAAAARTSVPGMVYDRLSTPSLDDDRAPPGYDALDDIAGYESFADRFISTETPSEVRGIKARIDREMQDRATLARSGWSGISAELVFGVVDPTFLASVAVPELALARGVRLAKAVTAAARGAAGATAYETAMHSLQETRRIEQSLFNIGAGALLSGVLGGLGRRVPKEEREAAQRALQQDFPINPDPGSQSFGAAASRGGSTLELEGFAAGGGAFSRAAGKVPFAKTDTQRIMESESLEARRALQELVDVPGVLGKNLRGEGSPISIETLVEKHMGAPADLAHMIRMQWKAYKARPASEFGEVKLSRKQFEEAVAMAARRGDRAVEPEIEAAAQYMRARVFDPLKRDAQKLKLLPQDNEIQPFAQSYFKRMYDRHAIRKNRAAWDELLTSHFAAKGIERAEARAIAEDVTRRILGTDVGLANFHIRPNIPNAGPLEARVLDINDELLEPFLVNDPIKVASAYVREMAPQVEITKRFGDKDARDVFQRVRDDYMVKRGLAAGNVKRLDELQEQEKDVLDTLTRLVLRLYGRAGALAPEASLGQRMTAQALRNWRNLVGAAKLGGTALTGGAQDLSKIVGMYGFLPTITKLTKLLASPEFRELSKANARRLGIATEVALARRVAIASDGAITEGWTEKLANLTYQASGLNHVTDMWRTLAATLIEDKILTAAADVAGGKALSKSLRTDLAAIGIDVDHLKRIADQAAKHGREVDGVRTSGSMQWTDSQLAELYDSAIVKEARVAVMQPGFGDRVWWTDSELGKTIGQLKAFSLSAPLRMAMQPIQLVGQGRYLAAARYLGALMVGGYLAHSLRQLAAGKEPATDPATAAGEAFAESGLGGVLPDFASPFARRFGIIGESARFSDRNAASAFGGPALGLGQDAWEMFWNRSQGGISARDLQSIRRMLPLQNIWYLRRAINAIEGEIAEGLDLQGATVQTPLERALETTPLPSSTARGPSGTGQAVQ